MRAKTRIVNRTCRSLFKQNLKRADLVTAFNSDPKPIYGSFCKYQIM